MERKMVRSARSTTVGMPEAPVALCSSRLACRRGGEARIVTPDRESSGESRFIGLALPLSVKRQELGEMA